MRRLINKSPVEQLAARPERRSTPWNNRGGKSARPSGPLVFFVGLSEKMLDEKQLKEFEAQATPMRESLLGRAAPRRQ